MKQMDFQPQGTCSKLIHIELTDDDRVSDVSLHDISIVGKRSSKYRTK